MRNKDLTAGARGSPGRVDRMRLELITNALKGRCSTIELPVLFVPEPPPHSRGRMDDTRLTYSTKIILRTRSSAQRARLGTAESNQCSSIALAFALLLSATLHPRGDSNRENEILLLQMLLRTAEEPSTPQSIDCLVFDQSSRSSESMGAAFRDCFLKQLSFF